MAYISQANLKIDLYEYIYTFSYHKINLGILILMLISLHNSIDVYAHFHAATYIGIKQ